VVSEAVTLVVSVAKEAVKWEEIEWEALALVFVTLTGRVNS
jgi:hypothetical protein